MKTGLPTVLLDDLTKGEMCTLGEMCTQKEQGYTV